MSSDEINYYRARREAERSLAASSKDSTVAGIHEKMADLYDKLIAHERPQTLSIVTEERKRA